MCDLEIYSRLRPGFITYQIKDIDLDTFDLDEELCKLRLEMSEKPSSPDDEPKNRKSILEKLNDKEVPSAEELKVLKRKLDRGESLQSQVTGSESQGGSTT